jgi:hypothetical protein
MDNCFKYILNLDSVHSPYSARLTIQYYYCVNKTWVEQGALQAVAKGKLPCSAFLLDSLLCSPWKIKSKTEEFEMISQCFEAMG